MFPYLVALLFAVVVMVLLYPLWRSTRTPLPTGNEALRDEARVSQSLEKEDLLKNISQLELEHDQGKLALEDYQRLKLMEERRLLDLLDAPAVSLSSPTAVPNVSSSKRPWGIMLAMGLWIIAGTLAVSSFVHKKIENDQRDSSSPAAPMGTPPINPEQMVARLRARLEKNPDDLNGQMMLGRSYMVLERWKEAEGAWQKALQMDARNPAAHAALGEILLRSHPPGDRPTAQAALVHFDKALIAAPQNPSVLWARGITLIALGRTAEADESWTTAYQSLSPETPEAKMVKDALEALRSEKLVP